MPLEWPATLPTKLLQDGFREVLPNNTISQEMDTGPPMVRRRGLSAPGRISGRMILTLAQLGDLVTFFDTTTKGGSLQFTFTHPRAGTSAYFMFAPGSPPAYTPHEDDAGNMRYLVDFEFLVMP